ncbi:hypothetical protein HDE_03280 [Halotydeus destructor]|nr:hypothetical protein HDE_03280 [Halotydeus destructor]
MMETLDQLVTDGKYRQVARMLTTVEPDCFNRKELSQAILQRLKALEDKIRNDHKRVKKEDHRREYDVERNFLIGLFKIAAKSFFTSHDDFETLLKYRMQDFKLYRYYDPIEEEFESLLDRLQTVDKTKIMAIKLDLWVLAILDPFETAFRIVVALLKPKNCRRLVKLMYEVKWIYDYDDQEFPKTMFYILEQILCQIWIADKAIEEAIALISELTKKEYLEIGPLFLNFEAVFEHMLQIADPDNHRVEHFEVQVKFIKAVLASADIKLSPMPTLDPVNVFEHLSYAIEHFWGDFRCKELTVQVLEDLFNKGIVRKMNKEDISCLAEVWRDYKFEHSYLAYLEPCTDIPLENILDFEDPKPAQILVVASITKDSFWMLSKVKQLNFDIADSLKDILTFLTDSEWHRLVAYLVLYAPIPEVLIWFTNAIKLLPEKTPNILHYIFLLQDTMMKYLDAEGTYSNKSKFEDDTYFFYIFHGLCLIFSRQRLGEEAFLTFLVRCDVISQRCNINLYRHYVDQRKLNFIKNYSKEVSSIIYDLVFPHRRRLPFPPKYDTFKSKLDHF